MKLASLPRKWHWVFIVLFFALSIVNTWFGLLGLICMGSPIVHALKGNGRRHCTKFCPRGSFLGTFMKYISFDRSLPGFMKKKKFRHAVLILMISMLMLGMYHSGGNPHKIAFTLFRFMGVSFLFGIMMGVFFKPKSWCTVCPMGHAATLITDVKKRKKSKKLFRKKAA